MSSVGQLRINGERCGGACVVLVAVFSEVITVAALALTIETLARRARPEQFVT